MDPTAAFVAIKYHFTIRGPMTALEKGNVLAFGNKVRQ